MMDFILKHWRDLLLPFTMFVGTLVIGLAARSWIIHILQRWAAKTTAKWDDVFVAALRGPSFLWLLILGLYISTQSSTLPLRALELLNKCLLVLWVLSFTIAASRLAVAWIRGYGSLTEGILPVTTLTQNLARIFVSSIGLIWILNILGVTIAPVLTALGVGGLAVALALQDTLSNLFAGIYISLAGQVRVGDYIRLNSGEEGYVADITWRSTAIRALANNLILVPNAKLAQAIVTNFHLGQKQLAVSIRVPVSYDADPDTIEKVLLEEANGAMGEVPGLMAIPTPAVRLNPGFGDSALELSLVVYVEDFEKQFFVQHELRRRIFKRFRAEEIEIPLSTRYVKMR